MKHRDGEQTMLLTKTLSARHEPLDPSLQRLAGAVLIQALEDLTRGPKRSWEEALQWMLGHTKDGFNFELCCNLLGREPNDVLRRVQRFFFIPTGTTTSHGSYAESFSYFVR